MIGPVAGSGALALAALAAFGYGSASVLQAASVQQKAGVQRKAGTGDAAGTSRVPGSGPVATLLGPLYLIGIGLDLLAWLASLAALRSLPVFEVQAVLAGSLAVTAVLARLVLGAALGRAGWLGIVAAVSSIAVLAGAAGSQSQLRLAGSGAALLGSAAIPVALAGVAAARAGRCRLSGALAGLAFGGAALCARAVQLPTWAAARSHPALLVQLAAHPLVWGLLGFGVTGMLLYAQALEGGDAARVTALLWITEVAVPSVAGVLLLGDRVRAGWWPAAGAAIALCLVASWLLAADESGRRHGPDGDGPVTRAGLAAAGNG